MNAGVQGIHRWDAADRDAGQRLRQARARPHPQQLPQLHELPGPDSIKLFMGLIYECAS
jgi:hypothetical protein